MKVLLESVERTCRDFDLGYSTCCPLHRVRAVYTLSVPFGMREPYLLCPSAMGRNACSTLSAPHNTPIRSLRDGIRFMHCGPLKGGGWGGVAGTLHRGKSAAMIDHHICRCVSAQARARRGADVNCNRKDARGNGSSIMDENHLWMPSFIHGSSKRASLAMLVL